MISDFGFFRNALHFAAVKHAGQKRRYTNEPYLCHLIQVAAMCANFGCSRNSIKAALLHDVIEDTDATYAEVKEVVGDEVATIIVALTDCSAGCGNRETRKRIDRARLAIAGREAQEVKLADLMDNTVSIVEHDPNFAKVYLQEKRLLLDVMQDCNPTMKKGAEEVWAKAMEQMERSRAWDSSMPLKQLDGEPIPAYADVFTLLEFAFDCKRGAFNDHDGSGNFACPPVMWRTPTVSCEQLANGWLPIDPRFTHVAWFNK